MRLTTLRVKEKKRWGCPSRIGNLALQSPFDRMGLCSNVLTGLDILIDGIEHALCHGADTGMTVA